MVCGVSNYIVMVVALRSGMMEKFDGCHECTTKLLRRRSGEIRNVETNIAKNTYLLKKYLK